MITQKVFFLFDGPFSSSYYKHVDDVGDNDDDGGHDEGDNDDGDDDDDVQCIRL